MTGNTLSDQGMLFGTFLMKNIFVDFPTHILKYIFCYIQLKNSCFLEANLIVICVYIMIVQIEPMKTIEFLTKSCKNYSSKYELENRWKYFSSEMSQTTFPGHWMCFRGCLWRYFLEKPWKYHAFSDQSATVGLSIVNQPYINCARPSTALWHTFGRCAAEALSLRVFGAGSSASDMLLSSMNTMFSEVFRARD